MLAIRMQRTGRKAHAMFRVVVQDSRRTPTSGKVVALLGSYDPHAKTVTLKKDKVTFYLEHGAQPSDRAAKLFEAEGIMLPKWVLSSDAKKRPVRNPEKLRKNQPAVSEEIVDKPVEEKAEAAAESAVEETAEKSSEAEA
jgi:small subunit ribosomal protein S16